MTGFFDHPGTPAGDLPGLAAGIQRLAGGEAMLLSRSTIWSAAQWEPALELIGDRPDRDELIRLVANLANPENRELGWTPGSVAASVLGALYATSAE